MYGLEMTGGGWLDDEATVVKVVERGMVDEAPATPANEDAGEYASEKKQRQPVSKTT